MGTKNSLKEGEVETKSSFGKFQRRILKDLAFLSSQMLDLIIPLKCIKCGEVVKEKEGLCPGCWKSISFISPPFCACCGLPFEFEIEEGALCPSCSTTPPSYTSARAVFTYTSESKALILKFKHLDGTNSAPLFGRWMAQKIELTEGDLCVPVPLHWTRLFSRTYNQAALLAREIAKRRRMIYAPHILLRKRRTPSQGYFSKKERFRNVEGAFAVSSAFQKDLKDKVILLVDDVFTTGATLKGCAEVLKKAGAKEVHGITLGRVGL